MLLTPAGNRGDCAWPDLPGHCATDPVRTVPILAETKDTPDAPAAAKKELEKLGPMSFKCRACH
jgi:hypothetical protein